MAASLRKFTDVTSTYPLSPHHYTAITVLERFGASVRKAKSMAEQGLVQLPGRPVYVRSAKLSAERCTDIYFKICCRIHQVPTYHRTGWCWPRLTALCDACSDPLFWKIRRTKWRYLLFFQCSRPICRPLNLSNLTMLSPERLRNSIKPSLNLSSNLSGCHGLV